MSDALSMRLDSNALRELREERLRGTVELCFDAHPFYRRQYRQLGLRPRDIQSLDDLQKLPLVRKADYMATPEDFRLQAADVPGLSFEAFWDRVGPASALPPDLARRV